jgi:hypothetical protein
VSEQQIEVVPDSRENSPTTFLELYQRYIQDAHIEELEDFVDAEEEIVEEENDIPIPIPTPDVIDLTRDTPSPTPTLVPETHIVGVNIDNNARVENADYIFFPHLHHHSFDHYSLERIHTGHLLRTEIRTTYRPPTDYEIQNAHPLRPWGAFDAYRRNTFQQTNSLHCWIIVTTIVDIEYISKRYTIKQVFQERTEETKIIDVFLDRIRTKNRENYIYLWNNDQATFDEFIRNIVEVKPWLSRNLGEGVLSRTRFLEEALELAERNPFDDTNIE